MKSRFKFGSYIVIFLSLIFTGIVLLCLSVYLFGITIPIAFYLVLNAWVILVWIWLVYGELRTKVVEVYIGFDYFTVKGYLGFGPSKTYYFNEADGYLLAILPAKGTSYEFLYIVVGGKKVIKISQFYHSNYAELKDTISSTSIKYLGYEDFSYGKEIKEIFV